MQLSRCAGLSVWASHPSATLRICSLGSSEAEGLLLPNSQPGAPISIAVHRYLPARAVLAPVEAGEELLLVSPAREVRLEWKAGVGRFNLLPDDGITLKNKKILLAW